MVIQIGTFERHFVKHKVWHFTGEKLFVANNKLECLNKNEISSNQSIENFYQSLWYYCKWGDDFSTLFNEMRHCLGDLHHLVNQYEGCVTQSLMAKLPAHSTDRPKGFKVTMYGSALIGPQCALCKQTFGKWPLSVKCWCRIKGEYPQWSQIAIKILCSFLTSYQIGFSLFTLFNTAY